MTALAVRAGFPRFAPSYAVTVCGDTVRIVAPQPGQFDPEAFTAFCATEEMFGLDVETTADTTRGQASPDFRLRLVQVASPREAWVLDPSDPPQRAALVGMLRTRWFVTHTNYDVLSVWFGLGVALGQRVVDTHLISKLIDPDELAGHGIKELTARHLDAGLVHAETALHAWFHEHAPKTIRGPLQKERWGWDNVPAALPEYVTYAGLDAVYARRLLPVLLTICHPVSHLVVMEHWLAAQATGATIRGLRLDVEYTRGLLDGLRREHDEAETTIRSALGFGGRSPHFAEWVGQRKPLPNLPKTPTGRPQLTTQINGVTQVRPDLLESAKSWPEDEARLLDCKATITRTANLISNLKQFLGAADTDGRVHPSVNTLRARTGRMSVTRPALQTLKKRDGRLRRCFQAEPGHVLVACDFAQVEVRVTAALTEDSRLTQVIRDGADVHDVTALALFGPDFTKPQRDVGKRATFGTIYGGGARGLSLQTGVPEPEARKLTERWHSTYPGIRRYATKVGRLDTVITASGRRIPADPLRRYANINYAVQSTARDLLVESVYVLLAQEGLASNLWMFVHDEVIVSVPEHDAERVRELMEKHMTGVFWGVPIAAEAEVLGTYWGKEGTK